MISRWAYTQATAETKCPKCGSLPGSECRTPKGRTAEIHKQRFDAYCAKIGADEFDKRHSVRALTMEEVMAAVTRE